MAGNRITIERKIQGKEESLRSSAFRYVVLFCLLLQAAVGKAFSPCHMGEIDSTV